MKNSSKFLIIVSAAILILIIVIIIMARSISDNTIRFNLRNEDDYFMTEREHDEGAGKAFEVPVEDFNSIKVEGGWDVLVIAADEFSVSIKTSKGYEKKTVVKRRGDELLLGFDSRHSLAGSHGASASIYMPNLKEVGVEGAVNMNIEGFTEERLRFKIEGAGKIIGEECVVDELGIDSNGAVKFDFSDSDVENAELFSEGAGKFELNMTGGSLTGNLEGISSLEYSGDVSLFDVNKDGLGSITRK